MKKIFLLFSFILLLATVACKKYIDKCKNIYCNTGTCINGSCNCPAGFEGENCEIELTPVLCNLSGAMRVKHLPQTDSAGLPWHSLLTHPWDTMNSCFKFLIVDTGAIATGLGWKSIINVNEGVTGFWTQVVYNNYGAVVYLVHLNMNQKYTFGIWYQWDSIPTSKELMCSFLFNPSDYSTGHPDEINLTDSITNATAEFGVDWDY